MKFKVYYKINNTFNNHLGGSDQVNNLNEKSEEKIMNLKTYLMKN